MAIYGLRVLMLRHEIQPYRFHTTYDPSMNVAPKAVLEEVLIDAYKFLRLAQVSGFFKNGQLSLTLQVISNHSNDKCPL